jgi:hypothetical protein
VGLERSLRPQQTEVPLMPGLSARRLLPQRLIVIGKVRADN